MIVYLATVHLHVMHIELCNNSIWYVCRGTWHRQCTLERKSLPIKRYFESTNYTYNCPTTCTVCEQHTYVMAIGYSILLWIFCARAFLSLTWSENTIADNHVVIELHQSKTDPL